jgi:hypothetical protein
LLEVTQINQTNAQEKLNDSEESEFEGFSEVSDGEYACFETVDITVESKSSKN